MSVDYSDLARAAQAAETQGANYRDQWLRWMVLCSAGGIAVLLTQASQLCSPEYALRALAVSYAGFAVGMLCSWLAFGCRAQESTEFAHHLSSAHNREQAREAANKLPIVFSAPASMSSGMNARRDGLVAQCNTHHNRAEAAWLLVMRWRRFGRVLTVVASLAIVCGIAWVPGYVLYGGRLTPENCATKR
jgi:hypothetical protein